MRSGIRRHPFVFSMRRLKPSLRISATRSRKRGVHRGLAARQADRPRTQLRELREA